jgi:hypothetical protein
MKLMLAVVFALAVTVTAVVAQCQCDDVALQRQVHEYNKLALRCEQAARDEHDYLMRLWHWKACMWDVDAPRFGDQIERAIKFGIYEPRL